MPTDTMVCIPTNVIDADSDSVSFVYAWAVDGVVNAHTSNQMSATGLGYGQSITCTVTPNDGTDDGVPVTSNTVTVGNSAPGAPTAEIPPAPATTRSGLPPVIVVASVDPEGDPVSYTYNWYLNGVSMPLYVSDQLDAAATTRGDVWSVEVTPDDGVTMGAPGTDDVVIDNSAPSISVVTLSPDPANRADTLDCQAGVITDADGDAVSTTFAWEVNGVDAGVSAATLAASTLNRGDEVRCSVTPDDGTTTGVEVSSNLVTIENSLPSPPSVSIAPSSPTTTHDLVVSITAASIDLDGDPVTYSYRWYRDGALEAGMSGDTVASTDTNRGEIWLVEVVPNDGLGDGVVGTDQVTIENSPPSSPTVNIYPYPAGPGQELTAVIVGASADSDNDNVTYSYEWLMASTAAGTPTIVGNTSDKVATGTTASDELWRVEVIPTDGVDDGPMAYAEIVITTNASPNAMDDLFNIVAGCTLDSTDGANVLANDSDPDGDPLTVSLVTDAVNGLLQLNADGTFVYNSSDGISDDSFTYEVSDGMNTVGPVMVAGEPARPSIGRYRWTPSGMAFVLSVRRLPANTDMAYDACAAGSGDDVIAVLIRLRPMI